MATLEQIAAERGYPRIVTPPPGPKAQAIIDKDEAWSSTSYIKAYKLAVDHGRGPMVEDVDGNRYLDFMSGIAVSATGYSHPKVVAAVKDAADKFFHICGTDFYYQGMSDICERLGKLAPFEDKARVFLTNSGTEAVEGAIKLVRNSTRRSDLISFVGAFHGRSYGAMSLGASKVAQRATFGPMVPGVHHVPFPNAYRAPADGTDAGQWVLDYIKHEIFGRRVAPDEVAGIFIEPMQGEGGYIIPPPGFLEGLRAMCDEHGIMLVFDEVQTGVGRTGKMWAADRLGVEPDVLLTAKGLGSGMPIGAIIAKESMMKWATGSHGSTFGGNPLACAAALATLDLVEESLADNARNMGERLLTGMRGLMDRHPSIGDVRGTGLFVGVELVEDRASKEPAKKLADDLMQLGFERGVLLLPCGKSTLRLAPPLVVDEFDIDMGVALIDECLTELTS